MAQNWVQHALDRTGWQPQSQVTGLIVLGVFIALVFAGVYLTQIANYATINREISEAIELRDRLERENEELRAKIASLQTVPRLQERAEALGFSPADENDIRYLTTDGYNPNRTETVVTLNMQDEMLETPQYDATFSGWLRRQWDSLRLQFQNFGE